MITARIVRGEASGPVLKSDEPINFLAAVDRETGVVRDAAHPLHGRAVGGAVLAFPHGAGSSVGAYTIYSLGARGAAPAAVACLRADLTVATGCALAGVPMVVVDRAEFGSLRTGARAAVSDGAATLAAGGR